MNELSKKEARTDAFFVQDLTKEYVSSGGSRVSALDGVSFEAPYGKITCIVGPTGSGKSTILRIVSGLESAGAGTVSVAGRSPSEMRGKIGYLTQRHTLFPWMKMRDNIGLPLEIRGADPAAVREKVSHICGMMGIRQVADLYPHELSGGMQQRAALGRLLASEASYWLLDEPFSALDDRTSHKLQQLLLRLAAENDVSALFVTHAIDEAVFLADRIIVISAGPGRVVDLVDPDIPHPRNRLSPEYGKVMEQIRCRIESVLGDPQPHA